MTTYTVRRTDAGRPQPLWEVMQGIPPMPAGPKPTGHYEPKRKGLYGPVRSPLRLALEAMAVGDEITVWDRSSGQVAAIAHHVRYAIPEARYSCKTVGGSVTVRRVS